MSSLLSRASCASLVARPPAARRGRAQVARAGDASSASPSSSSSASASSSSSGKMRVAISGASGFVGTRLVAKLLAGGNDVVVLTRDVEKARAALRGSFSSGTIAFADPAAMAGGHLGVRRRREPGGRADQHALVARDQGGDHGVAHQGHQAHRGRHRGVPRGPKAARARQRERHRFLRHVREPRLRRERAGGGDYLSKVCQAWESTARELERTSPETRVVLLRLGIVLDRDGGALGKMLPTFQIFAGGPMGDGAQWFSWIHREDAVGIILESLSNTGLRGPVNVTAPNPVRMGEMCAALGRTLGRPSWLPVPDFAIQALLGEGATVVLQGQKVEPSAALAAGYKFKYERLDDALGDILR